MVPSPWKRPGDPRICPTRSERCSGTSRELTRRRPERVSLNEIWFALFIAVIAGYVILDGFDLGVGIDRKSTRLNSSHRCTSYAVFCLKKKNKTNGARP